MTGAVKEMLKVYVDEDKIFVWDGGDENEK